MRFLRLNEEEVKRRIEDIVTHIPVGVTVRAYVDNRLKQFEERPEWRFLYYAITNYPERLEGMLEGYHYISSNETWEKTLEQFRELYILGKLNLDEKGTDKAH